MFSSKRSTIPVVLAAALMLPLSACGSGLGTTIQQALSADPQANQWGQGRAQAVPQDFPPELRYPNAALQEVQPAEPTASPQASAANAPGGERRTRWATPDPVEQVQNFYQGVFQATGWTPLDQTTNGGESILVARRGDLQVTVSILNPPAPSPTPGTQFVIQYLRDSGAIAAAPTPSPSPPPAPSPPPDAAQNFTDLGEAPKELQPHLKDLAQLGVLTASSGDQSRFQPNQPVSRRSFAQWLVAANNRIYRDQPARQIRPVPEAAQPAFQDVPRNDPAFPAIQGLAEAGYIPSALAGEANAALFRPNAPLTREDLLLWKVPVDIRQILPTASADGVKQTWGFKDASRINPRALSAALADHRNGDLANIRRVFGSTLLFQPKKPVTRAEAAAALWYIGAQGDGFSAQDILKGERQAAAPSPSPQP